MVGEEIGGPRVKCGVGFLLSSVLDALGHTAQPSALLSGVTAVDNVRTAGGDGREGEENYP